MGIIIIIIIIIIMIPERLRDVSCIGTIQLDITFTFKFALLFFTEFYVKPEQFWWCDVLLQRVLGRMTQAQASLGDWRSLYRVCISLPICR